MAGIASCFFLIVADCASVFHTFSTDGSGIFSAFRLLCFSQGFLCRDLGFEIRHGHLLLAVIHPSPFPTGAAADVRRKVPGRQEMKRSHGSFLAGDAQNLLHHRRSRSSPSRKKIAGEEDPLSLEFDSLFNAMSHPRIKGGCRIALGRPRRSPLLRRHG